MRATKGSSTTVAAVVAALLLIVFAGTVFAAPAGTDFRVSNSGVDGDTDPGAFNPAVVYNSTDNEYLAVWYGDGDNTFEYEIYGQRLDETGDEVGTDFRISNVGVHGDTSRIALDPAVAHDPLTNRYLVVWNGNEPYSAMSHPAHSEIAGQLLEADGTPVGGDFRISNAGPDTNQQSRKALRFPSVTFNAQDQEYLVVWSANPVTTENFNHFDIWGQRVSAAGVPDASGDVRISQVGTNAPFDRSAFFPDVTHNSQSNEYLVTWYANDMSNTFEYEIWGQRVNATGTEVGADDFRISNVGPDDDGLRDTGNSPPSVAYNSQENQYLVVWYGDGLTTDDDYEIFGQRLDAAGTQIPGIADFRISNGGPEGRIGYGAFDPAVTYNPQGNEYLVTWYGNTGNEVEICGQRVSASGTELGQDLRVSDSGGADTTRAAFFPDVAYNSGSQGPNAYLAVWYGDGLETNDELEVFGRRLGVEQPCTTSNGSGGGTTPPPPPPAPAPTPPVTSNKVIKVSVNASSTQKVRSKALMLRAGCDQACTLTASARVTVPGASKVFRLRSVTRSLAANKRVTLKLKLSGKTLRAIKSGLKKGKRISARVTLTAKTTAGGSGTSRKSILLRR